MISRRSRPAIYANCLIASVAGLLVLAGGATACAEPKQVVSIEGITEYRLDNGLRVLLFPDDSRPTVTVNLTVLVGSRHEGYGETGMAHLLEHMVFKGTPDHPDISKVLQERGARFNGTTWVDRTNYYETLPASDDNLEFALALEADRLVNSLIRKEDLLSEMTVVRNEFESGENTPYRVLHQRIMATAYEWHNYGKSTIGNRSDIERVPIQNLQAFYKKHYQPDNAVLVVAGKFAPETALDKIQATFGKIKRPQRKLDATYTEEPPQDGERLVTLRRVGDVGVVGAMYHIPAGPHEDIAALDVLSKILSMPPSGRLYKALVESKKATDIDVSATSWHDPGVLEVFAEVRREQPLEEVRDVMLEIVEQIGQQGVTSEEVDRARQQLLKQRELAAANTTSIAVQLSDWAAQGDWRLYFLDRDRVEKVTPDDVKAAAARYLQRNNRTVGLFVPSETSQRAEIPAAPDVAALLNDYRGRELESAGEAFDVSAENIEARSVRGKLGPGIATWYLPKRTRGQTVELRLVLRYGEPATLPGFEAISGMLPPLMTRGTKRLSRQQIQDELDKNRATLNASGDTGVATFSIQTKRDYLPAVLDLLRQILREPALDADELEVLKNQRLAGLEEQKTDPQALALTRVRRALAKFEPTDVRYVPTVDEDIERTQKVSAEQAASLHADFIGAQAGEMAIVGDFDPAEIEPLLAQALEGWTAPQPYARIPKVFQQVQGERMQVETPDKANAVFVAGLPLELRDDSPDYAPLVLGNFVLGSSGLSSRLGDRIRQKEGLSYGTGSFLSADSMDERGSLVLYAICNPQNMAKVELAMSEELQRLVDKGVTADELAQAQQGYLQQQQVSRSTDSTLASLMAGLLFANRTMTYQAELERQVAATTAEQVQKALKKHVQPKRLEIAVAGDFAAAAAADAKADSAKSDAKGKK